MLWLYNLCRSGRTAGWHGGTLPERPPDLTVWTRMYLGSEKCMSGYRPTPTDLCLFLLFSVFLLLYLRWFYSKTETHRWRTRTTLLTSESWSSLRLSAGLAARGKDWCGASGCKKSTDTPKPYFTRLGFKIKERNKKLSVMLQSWVSMSYCHSDKWTQLHTSLIKRDHATLLSFCGSYCLTSIRFGWGGAEICVASLTHIVIFSNFFLSLLLLLFAIINYFLTMTTI